MQVNSTRAKCEQYEELRRSQHGIQHKFAYKHLYDVLESRTDTIPIYNKQKNYKLNSKMF